MIVAVGVMCEVAATMFGTFGKQLVSYSGKVRSSRRARLLKVGGLTVTSVIGPILDASAYALAPQSLIAPLNGLDIVWNTCSAPFTLGERMTKSYALGSLLVFVGSSLSSCFGQHHNEVNTLERERALFLSWHFLIYVIVGASGLLACTAVLRRRPRGVGDWQRGVALGSCAGFVAGNMFFLSEALGIFREALTSGHWGAWQHVLPYLVTLGAVTVAVANVPLMAKALEEYDALFMITLFAGCQITTACVSAQVVLREMKDCSWPRVIGYWACITLVVLGLLVVGRKAKRSAALAERLDEPLALVESPQGTEPATTQTPSPKPSLGPSGPVVWASCASGVGYAGTDGSDEELLDMHCAGIDTTGATLEDGLLTPSSHSDSSDDSSD